MKTKWIVKPNPPKEATEKLQELLNINPLLAKLLIQRDITTFDEAKKFFRPKFSHLHNPFLMKDMDKAVARLSQALKNKEKILIYGDYDVDGTTSVALVFSYLSKYFKDMEYYIPDRYEEGYGISYKGIDYAYENKFTLIIALDCGIKAVDKVKYANEKNIDFIICDHHTPASELPDAKAVLDPKRIDCSYPCKELSGCGVGFKFLQAFHYLLYPESKKEDLPKELENMIDLVCVSIASDIVPITGENRILAYYGLKKINTNPSTGLHSIIKYAGMEGKEMTISDLVFKIGPRINAAGRMESGSSAVSLLVSEDESNAKDKGEKIDEYNSRRKDLDSQITNEALAIIEESEEQQKKKTTVLFRKYWNKGVIGIVASRLIESYYRPTIILTESNGIVTGSARSVEGFNLYNAIDACSDLLEGFGGHKYAAGLTMKIENVSKFQEKFEKIVAATITEEQLIPRVEIDAKIDFADITPKLYRLLRQFAPFGPGNMRPVFMTSGVKDCGMTRLVGADKKHLKLDVMQNGKAIGGIAFGKSKFYESIASGNKFDVCYTISENYFNNKTKLQLMVNDIKIPANW